MADSMRIPIAKLNNLNYQTWQYKLRMVLIKEDLWFVINEEQPNPITAAWSTADGKAMATIGLLVEDNQLVHVQNATSAKEPWNILQSYQKSTLSTRVFLLKKLCRAQLDEFGNMETHICTMLDMVDELTGLGETLKENLVVALLLCSLPDSYDTLVTALESHPDEDLTLNLVKGKLIDEYKRHQESNSHAREASKTQVGYDPN